MDRALNFGLPFFYRIVMPGTIVTVVALPMLSAVLSTVGIGNKDQAGYLVGIGVLVGFTLSLLDNPIYQLLEGRTGWPRWLVDWRMKHWADLVRTKFDEQAVLAETDPAYGECWFLLRQFPVDEHGNPMVKRPSRIGNVIASYEQYPLLRYGMDDVFYWPRLWFVLDQDARNEIDEPWAAVDAILYTGTGVALVGILYILLAAISAVTALIGSAGPITDVARWMSAIAGGAALLAVFALCVRVSIPEVVANGERYKSVFDLYRSKLNIQPPTDPERDRWRELTIRLQYGDAFVRSAPPPTLNAPAPPFTPPGRPAAPPPPPAEPPAPPASTARGSR